MPGTATSPCDQHGHRPAPSHGCMTCLRGPANRDPIVDQSDPNRGRHDPSRAGTPNPADTEPYSTTSPEDAAATRAELAELRRRMTRKTA